MELFQITCDAMSSNSGNLFILQVDDMTGRHVKTLQSTWPRFQMGELQSGTTYKVNVRCENKHGRSDPLYLLVETLNEPIKQIAETKLKEENSEYNEMMAIIIGVIVSLMSMVIMIIIAVITIRLHSRTRGRHLSRSGSDTDGRLSQSSHSGYCTTISSDVAVSSKMQQLVKWKMNEFILNHWSNTEPIRTCMNAFIILLHCPNHWTYNHRKYCWTKIRGWLEIWPTCFRIWIILISIVKLLLEKLKPGHLQNDII